MSYKSFEYGGREIVLESGNIARQANGGVLVSMGGTVILATVVGINDSADEERGFLPLTVEYRERHYAIGKIPSGFIKRERPGTREVLISRLIDRSFRPLFPEGFNCQVQIIITVLSLDPEFNTEVLSIIAASAAIRISGIPFMDVCLGAAKVGYVDGEYVLNPSEKQLKESKLDLVVSGTEHAVIMVESEAKELSEETMLGALKFGHGFMQVAINAIKEFAEIESKSRWNWEFKIDSVLCDKVRALAFESIKGAYEIQTKTERYARLTEIRNDVLSELITKNEELNYSANDVAKQISDIEKEIVRTKIIEEGIRVDGRIATDIRPITVKVGILPRTHGSALFTRGETQAIVVVTLGTDRDAQVVDGLIGETKETFMLHYNFPPFSVGEVGSLSGPKRREIGHGNLAKRALSGVMPDIKDFSYVVRVVSEITESNGSSSMASVCGGCLSLMDAGVPISAPVAGIAMGLVKEGDKFVVLSDILGDEDHLGDMDFKVAGTRNGITALQMDIKIDGITWEIMQASLGQAKDGRIKILEIMTSELPEPRKSISDIAPRLTCIKINPEKIKDVIGKGGSVIRDIIERTKVEIDIEENGSIKIAAVDQSSADAAIKIIQSITAEAEVGKIYDGKVVKIADFGAFVNIFPGQDGLLHISQISNERIKNITDVVSDGQKIRVKVIEIDRLGKIRLSMKDIDQSNIE